MYPADMRDPATPKSKLRLLYEVAPISMLAEQAAGKPSTGTERVLDIQAPDYHQRASTLEDSPDDVALADHFYRRYRSDERAQTNGIGREGEPLVVRRGQSGYPRQSGPHHEPWASGRHGAVRHPARGPGLRARPRAELRRQSGGLRSDLSFPARHRRGL